jgi:hypothetical protein
MKKQNRSKSSARDESQQVARLYKTVQLGKQVYRRWLAGAESSISTSAGGLVVLSTLANAASINSTPDFASLAALYTTYRCRAIRVEIYPIYPVPVYTGAVVAAPPTVVAVFPAFSNTVPTTFAQALDTTGLKVMSGYKGGTIMTSYKGDPDAHLWTGTGSAIGNNEQFLVSMIGSSVASTASIPVFRVIPHYLVEFRITG